MCADYTRINIKVVFFNAIFHSLTVPVEVHFAATSAASVAKRRRMALCFSCRIARFSTAEMNLELILLFLLRLSTRFESSLLLGWAIDTAEATPMWRWILNYKPPHKHGTPKNGMGHYSRRPRETSTPEKTRVLSFSVYST